MEYFKELISFDTATEQGKDKIFDYVVGVFKSLDAKVIEAKRQRYIWASFGEGNLKGGVLLSGHLDVVPHEDKEAFNLTLKDDGNYYGRGTCDMKGFCAVALNMAKELKGKKLKEPVHFCFSLDEETGMEGIREAEPIVKKYLPSWGVVGEPSMMQVVVGHLGSIEGTVKVKGKAAHSSEPENGLSAINILIDIMNFVRTLRGIVNIGIISGGTAHNILAEEAEFDYQIRVPDGAEEIIKSIDDFIKAQPKGEISHRSCAHLPLVKGESLSKQKMLEFLGESEVMEVKYATEAGFLQSFGVTTVICGPGSIKQAHKRVEFCAKEQLEKCMEIMLKIKDSVI